MNLETQIITELWLSIESTYKAQNYSHAILDAMHYLSDVLREKSGLDGDGQKLVGDAMGGNSPKLRINKFQTQSEKDEQQGMVHLLLGLYQGVRNPRSHQLNRDDQVTADAIILFINYLLKVISQSQHLFTVNGFLDKVFDKDFVGKDEYADLLISQIPEKRRLDVLVEIYRFRYRGDGENLSFVITAILKKLSKEQQADFAQVISDDFMKISKDVEIRTALQILPPDIWNNLHDLSRMRIENRLINSIKEGKVEFDYVEGTKVVGSLGTWSRDFLQYFLMKDEIEEIITQKIETQNLDERRYIIQYLFSVLADVIEKPHLIKRCSNAIEKAITDGDTEIQNKLLENSWKFIFSDPWKLELGSLITPQSPASMGDIPF